MAWLRAEAHHDLGFSSLNAYAQERCDCSSTCAREARTLARRVQPLPLLCAALRSGQVSWSMAVQIARVAKPHSEAAWLARAAGSTVTAMRDLVRLELGDASDEGATGSEQRCTLTVTADTEDTWLLECVRLVVQQIDGGTANEAVEAPVAEAMTSLFERLPKEVFDLDELVPRNDAQNAWNRQLAAWRLEAERS